MFPGMWHGFPQYIEGSEGFLGWFPGGSCGEVEGDGYESCLDPLTVPIFLVSLDTLSKTKSLQLKHGGWFFCLEMLSFLECKSYVWVVVNPNKRTPFVGNTLVAYQNQDGLGGLPQFDTHPHIWYRPVGPPPPPHPMVMVPSPAGIYGI